MTPKRQRLLFVLASVIALCAGTLFTLKALRENIVFFFTPSELMAHQEARKVRIGGLVKEGSITQTGTEYRFVLTDGIGQVRVHFQGALPALFREGQGIIAEGRLKGDIFEATQLLAKHDERYMPKNVADKLKESGHWRETPP